MGIGTNRAENLPCIPCNDATYLDCFAFGGSVPWEAMLRHRLHMKLATAWFCSLPGIGLRSIPCPVSCPQ